MDHFPIRQTLEFGKSICTAGKSILNFIQLSSLVANIVKCGKCSPVKFANFVYFLPRTEKRCHYVEMW